MPELLHKNQSEMAPDFDRSDSTGTKIKLSDYRGKSNVVLVFNRGFS